MKIIIIEYFVIVGYFPYRKYYSTVFKLPHQGDKEDFLRDMEAMLDRKNQA